MKTKLLGLIACMALLGVSSVEAVNATTFDATGTFTNGQTLTGTMDVSGGVIQEASISFTVGPGGIAGIPSGSFNFAEVNFPAFVAPNTVYLTLVSSPELNNQLSMALLFTTPDASDLLNYNGGPIIPSTSGLTGVVFPGFFASQITYVDAFLGVDVAASLLTGTFTPEVAGVPGPIAGAGLPGMVLALSALLGWWRSRRTR
jgi:hypothetical protein